MAMAMAMAMDTPAGGTHTRGTHTLVKQRG